jgi:hypothetical protein
MLPYNPYLAYLAGLILVLIPIMTTWPGMEMPPWVGLGLAMLSAAAAYTLKQMAPASDVHKDSMLPDPPAPPTAEDVAREYFRLRREEAERLKQEREVARG